MVLVQDLKSFIMLFTPIVTQTSSSVLQRGAGVNGCFHAAGGDAGSPEEDQTLEALTVKTLHPPSFIFNPHCSESFWLRMC